MPDSHPMFSVLVPTYNQSDYLGAALDSLLAQSFQSWEAVITDDGSTDATPEVIKSYQKRDSRFRSIRKENGGCASALNAALRNSKGKWILWLSSDDLFEPEKMSVENEFIALNPGVRSFHCDRYLLYGNSGSKTASETWRDAGLPASPLQTLALLKLNFIHGNGICLHRELLEDAGGFDETSLCAQDFDMWLRLSIVTEWVHIGRRLITTRIHAGQGSTLFPGSTALDMARAKILFLMNNTFETLFPALDLSQKHNAVFVIRAVASLLASKNPEIEQITCLPLLASMTLRWLDIDAPKLYDAEIVQKMHFVIGQALNANTTISSYSIFIQKNMMEQDGEWLFSRLLDLRLGETNSIRFKENVGEMRKRLVKLLDKNKSLREVGKKKVCSLSRLKLHEHFDSSVDFSDLTFFAHKASSDDADTNTTAAFLILYWRAYWKNLKSRRIAVFGAGAHTLWLEHILDLNEGPSIVSILDDKPSKKRKIWGLPVISPVSWKPAKNDAILLSSDVHATLMATRCIELYGSHVKILNPYANTPEGPYPKCISISSVL